MKHSELAQVFEEWKTRYDSNPEWFLSHEDTDGLAPIKYGDQAAKYFLLLTEELASGE